MFAERTVPVGLCKIAKSRSYFRRFFNSLKAKYAMISYYEPFLSFAFLTDAPLLCHTLHNSRSRTMKFDPRKCVMI